jgi:hypothetical protein
MESAARRVNIVNETADSRDMTQMKNTAARLLLVLAVLGLIGTLCWIAAQNTAKNAPTGDVAVVEQAEIQMTRIDAIPALQGAEAEFLTALAPGSDFTEEQARDLTSWAFKVCEGITAEVPVVDMADVLVREVGMTDAEARDFVTVAGDTVCQ